ncbi:hypothetical protein JCM14469_10730 [Desulfatiferula olefinivorans]
MFFAGIGVHPNRSDIPVVVVEKVLKNARKEYHVRDIRVLSTDETGTVGPAAALRAVYEDDRFLRKKKVFSQNKRPPKNTYTPPLLVVSAENGGDGLVRDLRAEGIPVDALFFDHDAGWVRNDPKILRFGTDYHLDRHQLDTQKPLLSSSRLTIPDDLPEAGLLSEEIMRFSGSNAHAFVFDDAGFHVLGSFLSVLWHMETIFHIKRY